VEKDLLTETIESISNNFINGNLSDCKRQIQELGAEAPMTLVYVVLQMNTFLYSSADNNRFQAWVSKNLEDS
jgi:hypothetical protein